MGLPEGWVTDVLPNRKALKVLGNGVVPQQAVAALIELRPCDSQDFGVASACSTESAGDGNPRPATNGAPAKMTEESTKPPTVRRARGRLEDHVRDVCDQIVTGAVTLPEGAANWTPHRLAAAIKERFPGSGVEPSTGAIADTLKRWRDLGFAEVEEGPLSFIDYTDEGRQQGLTELKEQARQRRLADRRAAKDAARAAEPEPAA